VVDGVFFDIVNQGLIWSLDFDDIFTGMPVD
jgi:hypothetical protein